ncbi:sce7726 family protein [Emticicia sp. SJ17W-69]|uniref:sce7726 family protein n=1 Tax=Emticicia sp. SJ17W-69 TaxID=3421657 RepID=UPI003EC0A184
MLAQNKIESLRSLSFLYNTSVIKDVLDTRSFVKIEDRINKHRGNILGSNAQIKFSSLLNTLYEQMTESYCNEYIYKNTILQKKLLEKYGFASTTLLSEFRIGKSIADLVLLNGEVKVFEIKTDLDSLKRLDSQLSDYQQFADKVYIVTNQKFIAQLLHLYSGSNFGIIEFDGKGLIERKEAQKSTNAFSYETIFKLLRKDEYLKIVKLMHNFIPDVPNTLIFRECLKLVKEKTIVEFQKFVVQELKKRKIDEPEYLKNPKTPYELGFICYSLNLSEVQYHSLYELLDTTI